MRFWDPFFFLKKAFYLLAPRKLMSFLTISNENAFSKLKSLDWVRQSHPTKI